MKRALVILLALLSISASAFAADIELALGASTNAFELSVDSTDRNVFSGKVSLNMEADVYLDRTNGFFVNLGYVENTIKLGAGYALTTQVGSMDFIFTAGPMFDLNGGSCEIGIDLKALFQAYFSGADGVFARFGASLSTDFATVGNTNSGYCKINLLIPEFAIGYKF